MDSNNHYWWMKVRYQWSPRWSMMRAQAGWGAGCWRPAAQAREEGWTTTWWVWPCGTNAAASVRARWALRDESRSYSETRALGAEAGFSSPAGW